MAGDDEATPQCVGGQTISSFISKRLSPAGHVYNTRQRPKMNPFRVGWSRIEVEQAGVEPATSALRTPRSPTELLPHGGHQHDHDDRVVCLRSPEPGAPLQQAVPALARILLRRLDDRPQTPPTPAQRRDQGRRQVHQQAPPVAPCGPLRPLWGPQRSVQSRDEAEANQEVHQSNPVDLEGLSPLLRPWSRRPVGG